MLPETDSFCKTVLLVDSNQELREVRARRLRLCGITVHTAGTVEEARTCLEGNTYTLVLVAPRENPEEVIQFHRQIRQHNPQQKIGFLVGPPKYLSFTYRQNVIPMPPRRDTWADRLKGRLASA